jgi:hypothetical protein
MIRAAAACLLALLFAAPLSAQDLQPFTARYSWTLKGMNAGHSTLALTRSEDGRWHYESRSIARGLFRLLAPGDITQESVFRIVDEQVRPEHYRGDDGTAATRRDINVSFDWRAHRVTGVYEDVLVDLPIEAGVQDDLSIQVALMQELLRGRTLSAFRLLDRNLIKDYQYTPEGTAKLDTPLGSLQAVIYRSRKLGARSSTLFWCAPDLGFLPLKVERHAGDDKIEWSLTIQAASRP